MVVFNVLALVGFLFVTIARASTFVSIFEPSDAIVVLPPPATPTGSAEAPHIVTITTTTMATMSTPSPVEPPCSTEVSVTVVPITTVEPVKTTNCTISGSPIETPTSGSPVGSTTAAPVEPTHQTSTVIVTHTSSKSNVSTSSPPLPTFTGEAGQVGRSSLLGLLIAFGVLCLGT